MINEYRFLVDIKTNLNVVKINDVKMLLHSYGHCKEDIKLWFKNYMVSGHNLDVCVLRAFKRLLGLE